MDGLSRTRQSPNLTIRMPAKLRSHFVPTTATYQPPKKGAGFFDIPLGVGLVLSTGSSHEFGTPCDDTVRGLVWFMKDGKGDALIICMQTPSGQAEWQSL